MAEQAQRRAPVAGAAPNEATDAEEKRAHDARDYVELRHLLNVPDQGEISGIQDRLDNVERRTADVGQVVAEAIQLRREQGDDEALAQALAPTIQATLRESVRRDPHVLADALFPVMGPAIRKSITETLRSMLESFNEALENSLSWQGMQWRIEAMRTGKPFAEIVMMHSLLYRVEQIFLIHKQTGLVLNHVTAPAVATQDADMVAGMLTAIQQFVRDSFESKDGDALDRLNFGNLEIWTEQGPDAVLACVIRGHAPPDYRVAMSETLENIQRHFGTKLAQFKGDAAPFRVVDEKLLPLLETHYKHSEEDKKKPIAAIVVGAVVGAIVLGWIIYSTYLLVEWSKFLHALNHQPGIVVVAHDRENGKFHITGFRDPMSADPAKLVSDAGLAPDRAQFDLAPYFSLDDAMIARRSTEMLRPPGGVTLAAHNGDLIAEGSAPFRWIDQFEQRAPWIAGVTHVDDSKLENSDLVTLKPLRTQLESTVFTFPVGSSTLDPDQGEKIARFQKTFHELMTQAAHMGEAVTVNVTGHTDTTGVEGTNLPLSQQRADLVRGMLQQSGIHPANLRVVGVGTSEPLRSEATEEDRHLNRSVTFKLSFAPQANSASQNSSASAGAGN
jgi:outer membrane protein OmpA-like peptidoglycan-associated protein